MKEIAVIAILFFLLKKKKKGSVVVHNWDNSGYPMPNDAMLYKEFINSALYDTYNGNYIKFIEENGGWKTEKKEIKNIEFKSVGKIYTV
jgi:hypothetical protein